MELFKNIKIQKILVLLLRVRDCFFTRKNFKKLQTPSSILFCRRQSSSVAIPHRHPIQSEMNILSGSPFYIQSIICQFHTPISWLIFGFTATFNAFPFETRSSCSWDSLGQWEMKSEKAPAGEWKRRWQVTILWCHGRRRKFGQDRSDWWKKKKKRKKEIAANSLRSGGYNYSLFVPHR